ncbi:putative H4MPT-linked C1 transfer pathway protein [Sphaerotilus hippei]|uniref:Putative H4MPT-linked C1 transfer pathway protein n=1 Tax=Sphaerotilus hippei TaxID=744406 RepID=A0A318H5A8_9BURK|nr:hydantoinase/oxoprolinase family protein [Sphaerotilus hippei]PXW91567.1 putative H4MPT-linked C1 transfer pathway protein [Sphaerotilus hippei]
MSAREFQVVGWDIGGAHLKACLLVDGRVRDVVQWACPLWQGLEHLVAALGQARRRWPQALEAVHAVTMTGEMTDLFPDRQAGVDTLVRTLQAQLPGPLRVYAGPGRWVAPEGAAAHWPLIASANWLATAQHCAAELGTGLLVDIGSTTTDLITFQDGRVQTRSRSDRDRLASGELAYHGAVRTPLCALASRIELQGQALNVMNELFATSADVYRLTGELDAAHDLHPAADGGAKTPHATRQRLARMVGCDVREAGEAQWLAFARAWRSAQVGALAASLQRVLQQAALPAHGLQVVSAGCGDFLVPDLLDTARGPHAPPVRLLRYGQRLARVPGDDPPADGVRAWAQVCAPSVAVAALYDLEHR